MNARWVQVTEHAQQRWDDALDRYHGRAPLLPRRDQAESTADLDMARIEYRRNILSAFWKLLVPLKLGEMVPHAVAELIAEEWDLYTNPELPHWSDP